MNSYKALLAVGLLLIPAWGACQTGQVYSATTPSCENNSAYGCATAAWRAPSPALLLVASGRTASCKWGSTPILWTKPKDLNKDWCVSFGSPNGFVPASQLNWPPVTTPPPDPTPPPRTSVVISVTSQRVYTNEPVTVSWTSQNALACTASWTQDVVLPSGSQTITMVQPMAFARVSVKCRGLANEYEAGTGWVVLSRAPKCYPKYPQDSGKVAVKALSISNFTLKYQVMAVYFCATPDGPEKQRWVLGTETGLQQLRKWMTGTFDEADVRSQCDAGCESLPDGAMKQELEDFARLQTPELLGVIQ